MSILADTFWTTLDIYETTVLCKEREWHVEVMVHRMLEKKSGRWDDDDRISKDIHSQENLLFLWRVWVCYRDSLDRREERHGTVPGAQMTTCPVRLYCFAFISILNLFLPELKSFTRKRRPCLKFKRGVFRDSGGAPPTTRIAFTYMYNNGGILQELLRLLGSPLSWCQLPAQVAHIVRLQPLCYLVLHLLLHSWRSCDSLVFEHLQGITVHNKSIKYEQS